MAVIYDPKILADGEHRLWPGIDSRFRLIVVAGLRAKQLLHGSAPRIEANKARSRNTSIAIEEFKRGLIHFTKLNPDGTANEQVGSEQ